MQTSKKQMPLEMSTIVIVRKRCQFCYAFFQDTRKIKEHSERCEFRFSETFEASDGKVKFACAVSGIELLAEEQVLMQHVQWGFYS